MWDQVASFIIGELLLMGLNGTPTLNSNCWIKRLIKQKTEKGVQLMEMPGLDSAKKKTW